MEITSFLPNTTQEWRGHGTLVALNALPLADFVTWGKSLKSLRATLLILKNGTGLQLISDSLFSKRLSSLESGSTWNQKLPWSHRPKDKSRLLSWNGYVEGLLCLLVKEDKALPKLCKNSSFSLHSFSSCTFYLRFYGSRIWKVRKVWKKHSEAELMAKNMLEVNKHLWDA